MVTQEKMIFTLEGNLLTPLLSPSPFFKKYGCWIKIVGNLITDKRPRRSYIGKLVRGERKAPTTMKAFRGFVRVTYVDNNKERGKEKIKQILAIDNLGTKRNLGYGQIQWKNYKVEPYQKNHSLPKKKFKIRKGLGPNYPERLQKILIALMLHDFVHTEKHLSKIYQQITIEDEEIREACLNHHKKTWSDNQLLPVIKYYDNYAALIRRKIPMQTISRYDHDNGSIDFKKLVKEIEERQHSAYKLYNYIYQSKELERIVESMVYAKNSLKQHLLLMVNLAINGGYMGTYKIENDNIIITEKKNSASVTKKEELLGTKDAEMHPSLTMNNAESESATSSKKEEARNIGKEKTIKKITKVRIL